MMTLARLIALAMAGIVLPEPTATRISTLEHTAVAALKDLRQQPNAELYEYSGFIILRDGVYQYTMFPHTDGHPDRVSYDIAAHLSASDTLVGIYHSHPCYSDTYFVQYFSTADLLGAKAMGVPAFLLNNCTGAVHEFDWRVDRVRSTGATVDVRLADGSLRTYHLPAGRLIGYIGIESRNLDQPYVVL